MKYEIDDQMKWIVLVRCIDGFTDALRTKLRVKHNEGRRGWDDPTWTKEQMLQALKEHIEKGDMVDVAAIAMFIWNRQS